MRRSLCSLLVLLLALSSAAAQTPAASSPLTPGPLRFRDQFILSLGFLAFEPTSAAVAPAGAWQLDAVWTTANSWAVSALLEIELDARGRRQPIPREQLDRLSRESPEGGIVFADGEISRTALALRRGFHSGLQIELTVPFVRLSGGSIDGLIESFHDAVGLEQAGRLGAPKDGFFLFLDTPAVELTVDQSSSLELGDVVLSAKYRLLEDGSAPLGLSIEGLVKVPSGGDEPLISSGEVDVGAQLIAGHTRGSWSYHGSVGVLRLGGSDGLGVDSQTLLAALAGVERFFGERTSLALQGSVSESPFKELAVSRIGERSVQVTLGLKRALGRKNLLLLGFTENLENFNNSADVNLHLGFRRTLN